MSEEKKRVTEGKRVHHRGSYFFPILLIVLGMIFLAHNLELIPGEGWDLLVKLWPALLIVAGLDELIRRQGIAWPVLLVGGGVFLLVNNFAPGSMISWTKVLQLWPLLLIAFGIDFLFRSRTWWTTLISILLVVILVGGAVWWVGFQDVMASASTHTVQQALREEIEGAELAFKLGAGRLILADTAEEVLFGGTVYPEEPTGRYVESGGQARYTVEADYPAFSPTPLQWELGLTRQVPLDVSVENGAGELFLALERVQLEGLRVQQGAGDLVLRLPQEVTGEVAVDQAVGRIRILVPEGINLHLKVERAISRLELPAGYQQDGNEYTSPGFVESEPAVTVSIEQAVGSIEVQETE